MAASSETSTKLATLHSEPVQGTPLLGELEQLLEPAVRAVATTQWEPRPEVGWRAAGW